MTNLRITQAAKLVLVALLPAVGMLGCGKSGAPGSGLSTKNTVVYQINADIERLNPYISTDADAHYVAQEIWEALNAQNPRTLELIPGLASLPEISTDHLTYTYTLNPKAHWSDGKPFTGDDVIFSFKTVMNPKMLNSQQLRNYFMTLDSCYYPNGDKSKIAFHLSKPYFQADQVLGGGYVLIMPKHILDPKSLSDKIAWSDLKDYKTTNSAVQEFATWFESPELARDPKYQIGTGPYVFKGWITNDRITVEKNKNYWAMDMPWFDAYPDQIIFKTISDPNAALTALKAKDIDVMPQLTGSQYEQLDLSKFNFLKKDTVYYNSYNFVAWNNAKPLFADKKVRRALTELTNRDAILTTVLHGLGKKAEGPIIFTQPNADLNLHQVAYNPDDAKKLLAEAGWTDTDGDGILDKVIDGKKTPFKFSALVPTASTTGKDVLLIMSEAFRKVGIDMQITQMEWSVYLESTKTHNYDAAFGAWAGNASEDEIFQLWHSSQSQNKGSNYYSFNNPEADKIMEDTRTEYDKAKRYQMASRLSQIILEDQPVTFMFVTPLRIGRLDRFDNVEYNRQRPCFDPRYWIVRGSDQKLLPTAVPQGNLAPASAAK